METMLENKAPIKWYFKTSALVVAFLCIGPLMLPLVWFNPRFDSRRKVVMSVIMIIIAWVMAIILAKSVGSISEYYNMLKQSLS